jgi:type II secretory pathway predicted ATPase ExeA
MLREVMAHDGFTRDVRHVGEFETTQHQRIMAALKAAIQQGELVALSGIIGCGKTTTEKGYKVGQKPLTPELIEGVLATDLGEEHEEQADV